MVRVARSLFAMVGFTMAIAIFVLLGQQDCKSNIVAVTARLILSYYFLTNWRTDCLTTVDLLDFCSQQMTNWWMYYH
jgi:hypothetical protein